MYARPAACPFESRGRLVGEFVVDAGASKITSLRAVAADVEFAWRPRGGWRDDYFEPWHRVAIEWVASPRAPGRPAK